MSYMKKDDFKNSRASFVSSTVCNTKTCTIALHDFQYKKLQK